MRFIRSVLRNFRSFRDEQVFDLDRKPGLYYMTGRNEAEPELEANGAGKSTVWEAICWCFFGKTSRMLKAGEVGNWEVGKQCSVSVEFETDDVYRVTRVWNPNSLRVVVVSSGETRDLDQDGLEALLGFKMAPMLHSIMVAQAAPMFLDLDAPSKAALFSGVLDLDRWTEFADRASKRTAEINSKITAADLELGRIAGALSQLALQDFSAQIAEWVAWRTQTIAELEEQFKERLARRKSIEPTIVALLDSAAHNRTEASRLTRAAEEQKMRASDFRQAVDSARSAAAKLEQRIDEQHQQRKYFNEQSQCILCLQVIPHSHRDGQLSKLMMNVQVLTTDLEEANATLAHSIMRNSDALVESQRLRDDAAALSASANRQETEIKLMRQELAEIDRKLDEVEKEVGALEKQENPYAENQRQVSVGTRSYKALRIKVQEERDQSASSQAAASYWVKGFKELRLFLISEALAQLEVEVNSELSNLGMVSWRIQFAVESDTKSGTVRKGFSVFIKSPHNKDPVPWESWSGGESQRLRLAATMGLSNLVLGNLGVRPNVEVWDEPTDGLSQAGVDDLLETLHRRSHQLQRQIWVVDHKSLQFGGFEKITTVVKDGSGSWIEE